MGARVLLANETCARWLHVVNMHKPRMLLGNIAEGREIIAPNWMWPLFEP
jgi:hypothetical protein